MDPNYKSKSLLEPLAWMLLIPQAELAVLEQNSALTGVAAVLRWDVGATGTVLSLMLSVPYRYRSLAVYMQYLLSSAVSTCTRYGSRRG